MENGIEKAKVYFGLGRQPKMGFASDVPNDLIQGHVAMEGAELRPSIAISSCCWSSLERTSPLRMTQFGHGFGTGVRDP
jgi:hypothetical protein